MHLAFSVRRHIVCYNYVKSGFSQRQLLGQPRGAFNHPEQERLGGDHHFVQISKLCFQLGSLVARIARYDPVHQAAAEGILFN
ncbi:hypothetical protein D3C74_441550 [compost metagenome]